MVIHPPLKVMVYVDDSLQIIHLTDNIQTFHPPALTKCSHTTIRRLFTLMVLTPATRTHNRATNLATITPRTVLRFRGHSRSRMGPPTLTCRRSGLLPHFTLRMSNLRSLSRRVTCLGTVIHRRSHPTAGGTGTIARRVVLTLVGPVIRRLLRRPLRPPALPTTTTGLRRCFRPSLATFLRTAGLGSDRIRRRRYRRSSRLSPRTDHRRGCCSRNFLFRR